MTVKSLCDVQKARIINLYNTGMQQKDLASAYSTSPRTINRVLTEAGLLTPVAQRFGDLTVRGCVHQHRQAVFQAVLQLGSFT